MLITTCKTIQNQFNEAGQYLKMLGNLLISYEVYNLHEKTKIMDENIICQLCVTEFVVM